MAPLTPDSTISRYACGCGCGAMADLAPHSGDRTVRRPVLETSLSTEQQERRHAVATARVTFSGCTRFPSFVASCSRSDRRGARYAAHLQTSTGTVLRVRTCVARLPSTRRESQRRPCEAMTMRSQPRLQAACKMPSVVCSLTCTVAHSMSNRLARSPTNARVLDAACAAAFS
jgi:hypothetical protein